MRPAVAFQAMSGSRYSDAVQAFGLRRLLDAGLAVVVLAVSACSTGEEPVPFDLGGETTSSSPDASSVEGSDAPVGEDPNAGPRAQAQGFAEQQCVDDPTLAEGVIEIAQQDTGEVVNRIVVDCDDVLERQASGEPVGLEIIPEELRPPG